MPCVHLVYMLKDVKHQMCDASHTAHLRQECHNSKFGIFELLVWTDGFALGSSPYGPNAPRPRVIGVERNVCRCTFNRYSVITQFAKLAAGEQLCHHCIHRHYSTSKPLKVSPEKSHILSCDTCHKWGICNTHKCHHATKDTIMACFARSHYRICLQGNSSG